MGLEDFELGDELGAGATGQVYRAVHRPSGLKVALKTANPRSAGHALSLERELAALARLDHPTILHLYDQGVARPGDSLAAGTHWMALEHAGGGSLEDWRPGSWEEIRERLRGVLKGLAHAHARGLIHRDLKPANLLVCDANDVRPGLKIADFGLAWATAEPDQRGLRRAGSPAYMPPEQIRGDVANLGPWTDLYALACVAWEWLTGAPPYGWREIDDALKAHLEEDLPTFLPEHRVPAGVAPLLGALLAKDFRDRPSSAAHVLSAIERLSRSRGTRHAKRGPLPVPARWRAAEAPPSTAILYGVGLGLFARRDPGFVGRDSQRSQLWSALREVSQHSRVVAISGVNGIGRQRLIRWLRETVRERGCANVVEGSQPGFSPTETTVWVQPPVDEAASLLLDSGAPVLAVLRVDPVEDLQRLADLSGFSRIELGPLPTPHLAGFLQHHLGLERGLADQVSRAVDGHPGVALDRVRSWVASEDLDPSDKGFRLRPGVDPVAHPDVDDIRRRQLDRLLGGLPDDGRLAVALGALLGLDVPSGEWLLLLRHFGLDARHSPLRRLARSRLIEPTDDGWSFPDPGIRLALLAELDRHGERAAYHRAAAEVLERLEPTWERRERQVRHRVAADGLDGHRIELEDVMYEHMRGGRWVEVRSLVELLSQEGVDHLPIDHQYAIRYNRALASANLEGAEPSFPHQEALVALVPELPETLEHKALRLAIQVYALGHRPDRARALAERTDQSDPRVKRVLAMIEVESGGDRAKGIRMFEELYDSGDPWVQAKAANGLGLAYIHTNELEQAELWFRRVQELRPDDDHVPLVNLALVRMLAGDARSAIPMIRHAADLVRNDTISRRGSVALVGTIAGIAARSRSVVDELGQRALHATHDHIEDEQALLRAIDLARPTALAQHRGLLETLAERLDRQQD